MEILNACLACGGQQFTSVQQTKAMMHPSEENFNFDQCKDCGLVFLNPRVPQEQLGDYYSDWYLPYRGDAAWGKYGMLVATDLKKIDKKRVATIKKYTDINKASVVLDIGCGKPDFLKLLHEAYGCRCIGIDFSDSGWAMRESLYKGLELKVGEIEDIKDLPAPDIVTMWHYLEHDYDPCATLRVLREKCQPDARLIVEVPNHDSATRRNFGKHWAGYHTPRHTALYTPETMQVLFEKNGWSVAASYPYGTLDPFTLKWMSQMERQGIDWSKNMEEEFWGYVRGKAGYGISGMTEKWRSLGFMTMIGTIATEDSSGSH